MSTAASRLGVEVPAVSQHSAYVDPEEEHERRRALLMDWLYSLQPGRCKCPVNRLERRGDGRPSRLHSGCQWARMANYAITAIMMSCGLSPAAWDRQFSDLRDTIEAMPILRSVAS